MVSAKKTCPSCGVLAGKGHRCKRARSPSPPKVVEAAQLEVASAVVVETPAAVTAVEVVTVPLEVGTAMPEAVAATPEAVTPTVTATPEAVTAPPATVTVTPAVVKPAAVTANPKSAEPASAEDVIILGERAAPRQDGVVALRQGGEVALRQVGEVALRQTDPATFRAEHTTVEATRVESWGFSGSGSGEPPLPEVLAGHRVQQNIEALIGTLEAPIISSRLSLAFAGNMLVAAPRDVRAVQKAVEGWSAVDRGLVNALMTGQSCPPAMARAVYNLLVPVAVEILVLDGEEAGLHLVASQLEQVARDPRLFARMRELHSATRVLSSTTTYRREERYESRREARPDDRWEDERRRRDDERRREDDRRRDADRRRDDDRRKEAERRSGAGSSAGGSGRCFTCNRPGHKARDCPQRR